MAGSYIGDKATLAAALLVAADGVVVIDASAGDVRIVPWDGFYALFEAAGGIAAHVAASDPHGDRAFATAAVAAHAAAADPHGDRAYALALVDDLSGVSSVAAARANLGVTASGADDAYAFRANNLSDLVNAGTARNNLGLGTAATQNTGTSGAAVPLLNAANTHSGLTTFTGSLVVGAGSVGTNGVHVLVMGGSTAPTAYPANEAQAWVADFGGGAGLASWNFAGEGVNAGTFHGALTVAQKGGTFSADRADISYSGSTLILSNAGGEGWAFRRGATTYLNQENGSTQLKFGNLTSLTFPGTGTFSMFADSFMPYFLTNPVLRWPNGSPTVSLYYIVAGVIGVGSGGASGLGWIQNGAGESRVSSAVTRTTTTLAAITGLSSTLVAGRKYDREIVLFCDNATAGDGLKLDFNGGTATMTSFIAQGWLSDDTSVRKVSRVTSISTAITEATITGSTLVVIRVSFVCNVAGTFIPRVAKNSDAAGATLTVSVGSGMSLEDKP